MASVTHFLLEGYTLLLAYIFVLFLEYIIFISIFKREKGEDGEEMVKLRFSDAPGWTKMKVVMINLAIVLILIPFVLFPLKSVIHHYLEYSGFYLIPITFLAIAFGYLGATKEHLDHHWHSEDTVILVSGICAFLVSILLIVRLGI